MPKHNHGTVFASWSFLDPEPIERTNRWFILFGAVFSVLILWALFTYNWLLFLILFLSALLILFRILSHPQEVTIAITDKGIVLGGEMYRFRDIDHFWLAYHPTGASYLYIIFKSSWSPQIVAPINDIDPDEIREIMNEFVYEDLEHEETFTEMFARFLKL